MELLRRFGQLKPSPTAKQNLQFKQHIKRRKYIYALLLSMEVKKRSIISHIKLVQNKAAKTEARTESRGSRKLGVEQA